MRDFQAELDKKLMEQENDRDYDYNHCSEAPWVHDCMLRLTLLRRMPPKSADVDLPMRRMYAEGHSQERVMRKELEENGFRFVHFKKPLSWEKYKLKGQPDDLIFLDNGKPSVIDYKAYSSWMFREVKGYSRWEDLLKSKSHWIRHAPGQLMLYIPLLIENGYEPEEESTILRFKNRDSGEKHNVIVYYDDPYVQTLLSGLQKVNEYVENKVDLTPVYTEDCRKCCYKGHCFADEPILRNGLETINNEEAERKLTRYHKIDPIAKERDQLYKELRTEFLGHNVIIGDSKLTTTEYPQSTFQVPKEIKEQYKMTVQRQRFNIDQLTKVL